MGITAAKLWVEVGGDTREAENALGGISARVDAFSKSAQAMGQRLTTWVTLPLAGIGAAAIKTGADYDRAMNMLQANSGATASEMEQLRQQAEQLGADLTLPGSSAANAAQAMLELSKAGLDVNETLSASRGVLELAAAGQMDNARAAEVTANALNAFGLEGKEAVRVADLLAASANKSSGEVTDIADSLKMASAVADSANVPIEDLVTAISLMANAGIKGSDAGTSLKQMLLSLMAPSNKAKDVIQDLGIEIYDAQGNMLPMPDLIDNFSSALGGLTQEQRNATLATIFGSDAVRAANVVLMGGVEAFGEMKTAVTEAGAASAMAEAQTTGLGGAVTKVQTSLTNAMLAGVEPFKDELVDLADWISQTVTKFSQLDEGTREMIVGIGLVAAGIGPATWALGALGGAIGSVVSVAGKIISIGPAFTTALQAGSKFTALTTAMNAAFGASAVAAGALVVAIGALVAVWIQYNEQIAKRNVEGAKAVNDTWVKFFDDQVASGQNAIRMADEYIAAQERVRAKIEELDFWKRLLADGEEKTIEQYDKFSQSAAEAANSYEEYRAAAEKVAEANGLVIDSEGDLVQVIAEDFGNREDLIQANYLMTESEYDLVQAQNLVNKVLYEGTNNGLDYANASNDVGTALLTQEDIAKRVAIGMGDVNGAIEETIAASMEAGDITSIFSDVMSDSAMSINERKAAEDALNVALGTTNQAQITLRNDVTLLTQAYNLGVITLDTYTSSMQQAKDGTLNMDDAQRQAIQTQIDIREAVQAATEARIHQMELERSLSEVWANAQERYNQGLAQLDQQQQQAAQKIIELQQKAAQAAQQGDKQAFKGYIQDIKELEQQSANAAASVAKLDEEMRKSIETALASTAMNELNSAYQEGQITGDAYVKAVQGIQDAFGLTNTTGVAMAAGVMMLTSALEQGTVAPEQYGQKLQDLAIDAQDGVIDLDAFRTSVGLVEKAMDTTGGSIDEFGKKLEVVGEQATTASQDVQEAFSDPNWAGIGENISSGIAQGILDGIPAIQAAAAEAAAAAESSANTEAEIKSPSKKTERTGFNLAAGMAMGIRENREAPVREMASMTREVVRETTTGGRAEADTPSAGTNFMQQIMAAISALRGSREPINLAISIGGHELRRVTVDAMAAELGA